MQRCCEICGEEFEASPSAVEKGWGRFCSRECASRFHSEAMQGKNNPAWKGGSRTYEKVCVVCERRFTTGKKGQKCCSRECGYVLISESQKGEQSHFWKGGKKKENVCENCGKTFMAWRDRTFCSRQCQFEYYKGENNPNWRGGKVKRTCKQCGKEFEVVPSVVKSGGGKFCSRRCTTVYRITAKGQGTGGTDIEKILEGWLQEKGLDYEKQKPIEDKTVVDFFVEPNICIYADGDYWHSLPGRERADAEINAALFNRGYIVYRLGGSDIKAGERPPIIVRSIPKYVIRELKQAEESDENGKLLPIAVWHEKKQAHDDDLVVMRLSDFIYHFGN